MCVCVLRGAFCVVLFAGVSLLPYCLVCSVQKPQLEINV